MSDILIVICTVLWVFAVTVSVGSFVLAIASIATLRRGRRRLAHRTAAMLREGERAPLLTALLPAHNEQAGVLNATENVLASTYPNLEVIVIDDGSTDDTLSSLTDAYRMLPMPPPPELLGIPAAGHIPLPHERVWAVWSSTSEPRLRLIQKASAGTKSDAINAGINLASGEAIYVGDADGLLATGALLDVAVELFASPAGILAAGGTVLPINNCTVRAGSVAGTAVPRNLLARIQLIEYMRSFLLFRPAMSTIGALPLISGAFGVFRTQAVRDLGGFSADSYGEDMEFTVRLATSQFGATRAASIAQVPDAVLWTEVPESLAVLGRQRQRWARGLTEVLRLNQRRIGHGDFGRVATLGLPWMFIAEWLAPLAQTIGLALILLILLAGIAPPGWLIAVVAASFIIAATTSTLAVYTEQRYFGFFARRGEVLRMMAAVAVEQLGYHQVSLVWKLKGTFAHHIEWGEMPRRGFSTDP